MKNAPKTKKSKKVQIKHRIKKMWRSILQINDSPHRIAWGVAIGTFVAYLPIVTIQMVVGAILCKILRGNVLASLPLAWITNPLTILPIFFALYILGGFFTGDQISWELMRSIVDEINVASSSAFSGLWDLDFGVFWEGVKSVITTIGKVFIPMCIGGAIVGLINGAIFYSLVKKMVTRYQDRRNKILEKWGLTKLKKCES